MSMFQEKETPRSFTNIFKLNRTTPAIPDRIMDECLHYATSYATPQQLFEFYAKHDRLTEVVTLTIEKKIPARDFVDKVFAPYMKVNDYQAVLKSMKNLNPELEKWQVGNARLFGDGVRQITLVCF